MAAKDDVESAREEGFKESWASHCKMSTKELAKEHGVLESARVGTENGTMVAKAAKMEERTRGKRAAARKAATGKRKVAREKTEPVGHVEKQDTLQRGVEKRSSNDLYAIDEVCY